MEPQLVVAGMEPAEFTNVFPVWTPRPDITAIQEKVCYIYSDTYSVQPKNIQLGPSLMKSINRGRDKRHQISSNNPSLIAAIKDLCIVPKTNFHT